MSDRDDLIEILRNTYRATQLGFIDAQADAILTRWRLVPAHDGTHHWADLRPPSHLAFVGGAAGYVFRHCVWCGQWADTPTQICPGGWYTGGYRAAE